MCLAGLLHANNARCYRPVRDNKGSQKLHTGDSTLILHNSPYIRAPTTANWETLWSQDDYLWKQLAEAKWGKAVRQLAEREGCSRDGQWNRYCQHRMCLLEPKLISAYNQLPFLHAYPSLSSSSCASVIAPSPCLQRAQSQQSPSLQTWMPCAILLCILCSPTEVL